MSKNVKIADGTIEIQPLGPNAKRYIDLGGELNEELAKQGVMVQVVLCFSEPITTTVVVGIGVGVAVNIVSKVINRLLDLRAKETEGKTEISMHVEITNKSYVLPKDRDRLLEEYSEARKRFVILSGPSCVGKGPLQKAVKRLYPGLIDARPVVCTSRSPREGEQHGRDYYFLPGAFIRSLDKSPDFAVSPVRSDWQAIHLPQIEELLQTNDLVFAEVYYTFGPVLLERSSSRQFESSRVLLLPLRPDTPAEKVIKEIGKKLKRRATDSKEKIRDRSSSAPKEIDNAKTYTHRLLNPAGEDDIEEWKSLGTFGGQEGQGEVSSLEDIGPNARWLVETFVKIVRGQLPPGCYSRE